MSPKADFRLNLLHWTRGRTGETYKRSNHKCSNHKRSNRRRSRSRRTWPNGILLSRQRQGLGVGHADLKVIRDGEGKNGGVTGIARLYVATSRMSSSSTHSLPALFRHSTHTIREHILAGINTAFISALCSVPRGKDSSQVALHIRGLQSNATS